MAKQLAVHTAVHALLSGTMSLDQFLHWSARNTHCMLSVPVVNEALREFSEGNLEHEDLFAELARWLLAQGASKEKEQVARPFPPHVAQPVYDIA